MTIAAPPEAVLDFNPTVGMLIEGSPPADPATEPWRVTMILAPNFAGPPLHVHPHQQESYEVLAGTLDVFVDGRWQELGAGATLTVPAATPHTIRNSRREEVRAVNVHAPALDFPRYMSRLHALVHGGKVRSLPPRGSPVDHLPVDALHRARRDTRVPQATPASDANPRVLRQPARVSTPRQRAVRTGTTHDLRRTASAAPHSCARGLVGTSDVWSPVPR